MKTELLTKVAVGIATAAGLAGGGAIIKNEGVDAVQQSRIEQIETGLDKVDKLSDKLDETNRKLDVLDARLQERTK